MIERVLVAMDDSPLAERALEYALDVFPDAEIVVLHVAFLEYDMTAEDTEEVERAAADELAGVGDELAQEVFETVRSTLRERDGDVSVTFLVGEPEERIVEYAADGEFDQIVLGTHAREGVKRLLVGSVAETVARQSPVPTTLVK